MEVNFKNINDYLKNYSNKSLTCEHQFPKEYVEIGNMTDNSFGFLSYLNFKSNDDNEIFIGSYPYNSARLWKCKNCGRLTFSNTNDSGWGQLTSLKIDFEKEYLIEPANKSVSIKLEKLNQFISEFGFDELNKPDISESYSGIKIISKDKPALFAKKINKTSNGEMINFQIVANRDILKKIAEFENKQ